MCFGKKYSKEKEEIIGETLAFPYNIIPKGYPSQVSDRKIMDVQEQLLNNMKANLGVKNIIFRNATLMSLGTDELNSRKNRQQFCFMFIITLLSFFVAVVSLIVAIKTN